MMRRTTSRRRLIGLAAGAAAGALAGGLARPRPARARSIALLSQSVPLDPADPAATRIGALAYRGGIALRSTDRRFGGFSALYVSPGGERCLAVSDRGTWLGCRLLYDAEGRLVGAEDGETGALIDEDGAALDARPGAGDAEAMAVLPDGSIVVAVERDHRLLRYPESDPPFARPPERFASPTGIENAPDQGGIKALAHVGRGFFLAIAERLADGAGALAGWVGRMGAWEPLPYARNGAFRPADAALLPWGDVLVLERHAVAGGYAVRLARLARNAIAPYRRLEGAEVARWGPPLTTDNFEGLAVRRGRTRGEAIVLLISDDNANPLQRTLLLQFALAE
jgi:hypothetical protein